MRSPRPITSRHNENYKRWMRLLESRGIRQEGQFLVFGEKVIRETLINHTKSCLELINNAQRSIRLESPPKVTQYVLDRDLFNALDLFGTRFPLLVCCAPEFPSLDLAQASEGLELLCPLSEPSNVGALIRSAQAFGADKVLMLKEAAYPLHPKAVRAASGAIFEQAMYQGPSLEALGSHNIASSISALDSEGKTDLSHVHWPLNVRLLIGEEGLGQPPYAFHNRISIPMAKQVDSLNATIAASIALFSYRRQHPL